MASSTEAAVALTKEELQAALALSELAELVLLDFNAPWPPLPESLSWGCRRPRSAPSRPHHQPLMPSPPPPQPPPPDDKETVGRSGSGSGGGGGVTAAVTSSPTTPLSFQESGGEDVNLRPEPTAGRSKRDSKWIEQQPEMGMSSLSNTISNLDRQVIDEHKSSSQSSSPNSSLLRDQHRRRRRHHRRHSLPQQQRPQVPLTGGGGGGGGCGVIRVGPGAVERQRAAAAAATPSWGRHIGQWPVDELKPSAAAASAGLLPDLNVCPNAEEEQDVMWGWEQQRRQQMAYRAATSALARKRRLQRQREKRSSHFLSFH